MKKESKVKNKRYLEMQSTIKYIDNWYLNNKSKLLSVITYPYNEMQIFKKVMMDVVNQGGKILYICNNEYTAYDILKPLIKLNKNITYSRLNKEGMSDSKISSTSFDNIISIKDIYDLIIVDDISSLSNCTSIEMKEYVDILYKKCTKLILYTFEEVMNNVNTIFVGNVFRTKPFIEPRIINTRIDLNYDMPFLMYDYISWFKKNKRKILIVTPDSRKKEMIYDYYVTKLNINEKVKVVKYEENNHNKIFKSVMMTKNNALIIISDHISDDFRKIPNLDVIVYFSNDEIFTYKKLVYLCGEVGQKNEEGEVLLLSNGISDNIDLAKECARQYNKILWEKGLLS